MLQPIRYTCFALLATLLLAGAARADDGVELSSYVLLSDESVVRENSAPDAVYFAYDADTVGAKLMEFGTTFPKNFSFPPGSLYVLVVSDFTGESFSRMSIVKAKPILVVELEKDKDAKTPQAPADGKKHSRLLLIGCPPVKNVKGWEIKTADGKRLEVKATELKK